MPLFNLDVYNDNSQDIDFTAVASEIQQIKEIVAANSLSDLLEGRGDYVLVRNGSTIAFGINASQLGSAINLSAVATTNLVVDWQIARRNGANTNDVMYLGGASDGSSAEQIYLGSLSTGTPNTIVKISTGLFRVRTGGDTLSNPALDITSTVATFGPTDSAGTPIAFGSAPALTGIIRVPNNSRITWRNAANSADFQGITVDGSNNLYVGDIGSGQYMVTTSTQLIFAIAASVVVTVDGTGAMAPSFRSTGSAAASATFRGINNSWSVAQRNAANNGDVLLVGLDGSDTALYAVSRLTISSTLASFAVLVATQSGINLSIGSTGPNFNSGTNTMFVTTAGTAPTANPSGGGYLYAVAGAGTWRGTSGTVTTFGPADLAGFLDTPGKGHCPECGTDFAHEWQNDQYGSLTVCMKCLTDEIGDRPWIVRK